LSAVQEELINFFLNPHGTSPATPRVYAPHFGDHLFRRSAKGQNNNTKMLLRM
jgi:hypothetical protein